MRFFAAVLATTVMTAVAAHGAPKKASPDTAARAAPQTGAATKPAPVPKSKPGAAKANAGTQTPDAKKPDASKSDAAKTAALRDAYSAIPLAERMAIQFGLTWTGDYKGRADGEFSDPFADAVRAYQKRRNGAVTGVPTPEERTAIAAFAAARQNAAGWRMVEDPVTGARVGIPGRFATKITPGPIGTRWSSEQGQLQIETFRIDTGAALDAVFAQQKKQPRRRITASTLQPDSFTIAGMQGLKKLAVLGFVQNNEVRGLTILYDQAMEGTIDPLVAPMSAAFVPFAGYAMAGAVAAPRRDVEYGSGVVVSTAGHVLTDRNIADDCRTIALPGHGHAERIADDASTGLALLQTYGARDLAPIGLAGGPSSGDVTLLGIADPQLQNGGAAVTAVSAPLGAGLPTHPLARTPALGFAGAAAVDSQGRLAGVVVLHTQSSGPAQASVAPAAAVRHFLEAQSVTPGSGGTSIEAAKASVVRVICIRK